MQAQQHQLPLWGEPEILWIPEFDRVNRVIVKNALEHMLHELGELVSGTASRVWCLPMDRLAVDQRDTFERTSLGAVLGRCFAPVSSPAIRVAD